MLLNICCSSLVQVVQQNHFWLEAFYLNELANIREWISDDSHSFGYTYMPMLIFNEGLTQSLSHPRGNTDVDLANLC